MSLCLPVSPSETVPDRLATRLLRFLTPRAGLPDDGAPAARKNEFSAAPEHLDAPPEINALLL